MRRNYISSLHLTCSGNTDRTNYTRDIAWKHWPDTGEFSSRSHGHTVDTHNQLFYKST